MKHIFKVFSLLFLFIHSSFAANDNYLFGGRAAGMGNAAVTLYDFWAVSHNQAGLARIEHMAAGVYFENRYLVKELSLGAGAFVMPTHSGVFGFSFNYFGFELFNESKVGLAYARTFGDRFSVGIQLNYNNTYIAEDHGSRGNFTVEMGAIFQILPQLSIGAHIYNPTRARLAEFADERIPTIFRMGMAYEFSDKVIVSVETEKSIDHTAVFKAGIEYHVTEPIYLRGGIGSNPTTNAFGFGMVLGNLKMDLATSFHHVLGYSPQISFIYEFK
jgi:hypothetical protein